MRAATDLLAPFQRLLVAGEAFAITAGRTGADVGLYRVSPGASSLGPALALFGPQAPERLALSPGRVVFSASTRFAQGYLAQEQGVDVTHDGPRLREAERVVARDGSFGGALLLSGGLTANAHDLGSSPDVVVLDAGQEVGRVRSPGGPVPLSGTRVALFEPVFQSDRPNLPRTRVVDTADSDTPSVVVDGYAGLEGSRLAVLAADGSLRLRDLDSGSDEPVRGPEAPSAESAHAQVQLADGWVAWTWTRGDVSVRTTALERATGREVRLDTPHDVPTLSGGRLAWRDVDDREVRLMDLADGSQEVLGLQRTHDVGRGLLALAPETVAWVDEDDRTRLRQLAPHRRGPGPAGAAHAGGLRARRAASALRG